MKKTFAIIITAILLLFNLSACQANTNTATAKPSDSVKPTSIETPMPTATISQVATATPNVTPTATPVAGQKQMGYITKAYTSGSKQYITIDYIEFYTGKEAITKALADKAGIVEKDEDSGQYYIPNDYYIRNNNAQLRTFQLASGCTIKLVNYDNISEPIETNFADFIKKVKEYKRLSTIVIVNNKITSIEEYFVP